jgi:cell division protein FtsL
MTTRQTLHREPDPRSRRSMAAAAGLSALLVAATLGLVGLRVEQVRLSYQLDGLRGRRQGLEELNRALRVEVASLRSPARVEARARALGLTAPAREQVRLAREFVTGGGGTVAMWLADGRAAGRVQAR